jgi:hypothetical protein
MINAVHPLGAIDQVCPLLTKHGGDVSQPVIHFLQGVRPSQDFRS